TLHTETRPQKEPAATRRPSRLKVWARQPVPQAVFPNVRSLPVRRFRTTRTALGLMFRSRAGGGFLGAPRGGRLIGPARAIPPGTPMATVASSGLKTGWPPNGSRAAGTVATTRRLATLQIRIGSLDLRGDVGIVAARRPSSLMKTAPTFPVGE